MNRVLKTILSIIGLIILIGLVQLIFNFFSISVSDYVTYFIWIIALFIFYYILPSDYNLFKGGESTDDSSNKPVESVSMGEPVSMGEHISGGGINRYKSSPKSRPKSRPKLRSKSKSRS
jgi:hypothetical protein